MRIIAGALRGRRIAAPPGRGTRPTSDRVREALFSILGPVDGEDVLDLFAGSGALGLEALSRGAASATFVERAPRAAACIRDNIRALGVEDRTRVVVRDWRAALSAERAAGRWYGVVLVDPPYRDVARVAAGLGAALAEVVVPGGTVVIERSARDRALVLDGLAVERSVERVYGDTAVSVLRLEGRP